MNVRFIELLIGCLAAQDGIDFDFPSVEKLCREFDLVF
jgi:hypothetical protein